MQRNSEEIAQQMQSASPSTTIGIDLGDRFSRYCVLNAAGDSIEEGRVRTTRVAMTALFAAFDTARIALETGTHSAWVSELLRSFGHETLVAHACCIPQLRKRHKKNDSADAATLARYARFDPRLLQPIRHRDAAMQQDLALIRVRARLIDARTMLVNTARSLVKGTGGRLPRCTTNAFPARCRSELPAGLAAALDPVLDQIALLSEQVRALDRRIEELARCKYPETLFLRTVPGVGPLTALTFVLTLGDESRFQRSRDVGAYLGLQPRQSQSGDHDPQLRISKAGDQYLRKILVQRSHYILGPLGPDSSLRAWGLGLAARGGKNAKKRAIVAVARKLAVLLLSLWANRQRFDPSRNSSINAAQEVNV